jgi:hypothetical protein
MVVFALAGCGGNDYASKANDICKKASAQLKAIPNPTNAAGVSTYLNRAAPLLAGAIAKLKAIKPPSDKSSAYRELLSGLDQESVALQQAVDAAKGGDVKKAISLLQQQSALSSQVNARAKAAGLKECAKG